ncbi:hypothetical protein [Butyrivibrio sp. AC2005]|uniref:hypothetical protein n=1 Tax=Butyrivibrio sp. AC2005 TaxID=1280672 RepID=UPI000414DFD9|nr:hypothetical protein [Butyrivibrio sp. AC2005]
MRKNKFRLVISILVAVLIILAGCIAIIYVGKKTIDEKTAQINELQYEIDSNKQVVYVAKKNISAGETLVVDENIMKQEIHTGLEAEYYLPVDAVGGVAVLDIRELEPIMADMVTPLQVQQDTREYEIAVANLMTDQSECDYVDVRIMFPTGEDYTVLTKKPVHNLILPNSVFYSYLNEDEILRMASATIDAYTVTGTYIYTTRYVEPNLQEESVPNYVVRPEVIDLINSDPNILSIAKETLNLDARMNLEQRLIGMSEDTLKAVSDGHGIADTAKKSAQLGIQYQADPEDAEEITEETAAEDAQAPAEQPEEPVPEEGAGEGASAEGSGEETQAP